MRVALISDIHGNATALQAVLADIRRHPVDLIVCLGDVATLGPQPAQVVELLAALRCPCILGNHEAALFQPDKAAEYRIPPVLLPSLHWCIRQLTPDHLAVLSACQPTATFPLSPTASLACFHGSPKSSIGQIVATTSPDELDRLLAGTAANIFAGGHSHFQLLRQHRGNLIVNPGSVGSAFLTPPVGDVAPTLLPWAEYAVLDWTDNSASVDFRRVPFDIQGFLEVLEQSDLPMKTWLREQYMQSQKRPPAGSGRAPGGET